MAPALHFLDEDPTPGEGSSTIPRSKIFAMCKFVHIALSYNGSVK